MDVRAKFDSRLNNGRIIRLFGRSDFYVVFYWILQPTGEIRPEAIGEAFLADFFSRKLPTVTSYPVLL